MKKIKNVQQGFTLLELLVVVLIIGILASIALPQYEMAVTKAKVASMLPLMRRWKDALAEYKLQHGSYLTEDNSYPDADTLGVNWPTDWECDDDLELFCYNDFWACIASEYIESGLVMCSAADFEISMYQSDASNEDLRGLVVCKVKSDVGLKICKALGGKLIDGNYYKLN